MRGWLRALWRRIDWQDLVLIGFALACWCGLRWVAWDLRPAPAISAVDDFKYVDQAVFIRHGKWLGPYRSEILPMTKRPLASVALAATSTLELPLLPTLQGLFMAAVFGLGLVLRRIGYGLTTAVAVSVGASFLPLLYTAHFTRVLRDPFFTISQVAICGLALWLVAAKPKSVRGLLKSKVFWLLQAALAFHWGVREEAFLLYPGLLIVAGIWAWSSQRTWRARAVALFLVVVVSGVTVNLTWFTLASLNRWSFGVFLVDENAEGAFPKAMGALAAIDEQEGFSRLLIDKVERDRLNRLSPLFRSVSGVFNQHDDESMDYGHQIWYLNIDRPHVHARETQSFYNALRAEVVGLYEAGLIRCASDPRSYPVLPPFDLRYLPFLRDALSYLVGDCLMHFGPFDDGYLFYEPGKGGLSPKRLARFGLITQQPLFGRNVHTNEVVGTAPAPLEVLDRQRGRRSWLARSVYGTLGPWLIVAGLLAYLVQTLSLPLTRGWQRWSVTTMCLAIVAVRVLAIGYIRSIEGAMSGEYLYPCHPQLILFCGLALAELGVLATMARRRWWPRPGNETSAIETDLRVPG